MLMGFDPIREFDRLASSLFEQGSAPRSMPMDAYRHGEDLMVHLDLPGVDAESIELVVERNVLSVSARRSFDRSQADELLVSERPQGVYRRQVFLGEGLDTDRLEASYHDGVLTLRVPVLESARPRRVPIQVTGDQTQAIESAASHGSKAAGEREAEPAA